MRVWISGVVGFVGGVHLLEGGHHHHVATPSAARECAELSLRIGRPRLDGICPTCGGEAFELDDALLRLGPPPAAALPVGPISFDTSTTMPRTAALLDHEPTPARQLLVGFREGFEAAR